MIPGGSIAVSAELPFLAKKSAAALTAYLQEWARDAWTRASQGEPFVIADVFTPHEILEAMDIPFVEPVGIRWYYPGLLDDRAGLAGGKPPDETYAAFGPCGRCGIDGGLGLSQLRSLPRVTAMISQGRGCAGTAKAVEIWRKQNNAPPIFWLEETSATPYSQYPGWWEKIQDHWDEVIEPRRLDYRVQELNALIKFLEMTTGRTFSLAKLAEVMELANEQQRYWLMARDLIAHTRPSPIGVYDALFQYAAQWHRGTPKARDLARLFYEEVKERVDTGQAACAQEKLRLQWVKTAYYSNPGAYRYWEDRYGAVFVTSWYLSIAEGYVRKTIGGDPLRALAGKHLMLGLYAGPDWDIREARLHGVDGAVMLSNDCPMGGVARRMTKLAYEQAGIPMFLVDPSWNAETVEIEVSKFIETRLAVDGKTNKGDD